MSTLNFSWPACGANRDRLELEYISALAQSGDILRQDGTVSVDDILAFLKSRHGLIADREVTAKALVDLAGEPRLTGENTQFLDIPMLASLLLLPHLLRLSEESPPPMENESSEFEVGSDKIPLGKDGDHIGHVLEIILSDIHLPVDSKPPLTKDLVRDIFAAYNETSVSEELLEEMIEIVNNGNLEGNTVLDKSSFAKALTSDINAYNINLENCRSTHYKDFQCMSGASSSRPKKGALSIIDTYSTIDLSADRFQSDNYFIVLLMSTFVASTAYFSLGGYIGENVDCEAANKIFGCRVGIAIADWLWIFLFFGVTGCIFIYFASGMNQTYEDPCPSAIIKQLVGIFMVVSIFFLPFFDASYLPFISRVDNALLRWTPYLALVIGIMLLFVQTLMLLKTIFPKSKIVVPSCTAVRERNTKLAACYKVKKLYENAIALHPNSTNRSSSFLGRSQSALMNFEENENEKESVGGIIWVVKNFRDLQVKHGIWIGTRIFAACISQIFGVIAFVFVFVWAIQQTQHKFGEWHDSITSNASRAIYFNASGSYLFENSEINAEFLSSYNLTFAYPFNFESDDYLESEREKALRYTINAVRLAKGVTALFGLDTIESMLGEMNSALYNSTGIEIDLALEYAKVYSGYEGGLMSFVFEEGANKISESEALIGLIFGGVCGILAMLHVCVHFFPSAITQTLMFRYGVIMSPLTDYRFNQLRVSAFNATSLYGGAVWGILATGVTVGGLMGGLLFVSVWSETSGYMSKVFAQLIGMTVSLLIKVIILCSVRRACYSALYRDKPILSNIVTICLDIWSIGIAFGFIIARSFKLLLTTCVYLGRIDTPLLAPNVDKLGPLKIDGYPDSFTVDLLTHEAHRHPYLERLGLLYMLKIHYGDDFASRAGSCWRLIFTLALLPWLRQYRVKALTPPVPS